MKAALSALLLLTVVSAHAAGFTVRSGRIHDPSGRALTIRGINHFGFNDTILVPEYLWQMGWKQQIAQIKSLGFNAVRVPFVPDTLYNQTPVDQLSFINPELNADLKGKTSLQVLDLWMAQADREGLYVVLDFHSVSTQRLYPQWFVSDPNDYPLTYNGMPYSRDNWIRDLKFVAARYAGNPHFMGVDLYNEPHGKVRWGPGDSNQSDPAYYWKRSAEAAAAGVLQVNPNVLIFVEGIAGNFDNLEDSTVPMDFGEDLQPQAYQPLDIPASKLVLSPHTYGPDVFMKDSFDDSDFPENLPEDWNTLWGKFDPQYAIVLGEWGGEYGTGTSGWQDVIWQDALVEYLKQRGLRDSFYWAYTPNSGDAGGILDDNLNVREDKMALLHDLWGDAPAVSAPKSAASGGSITIAPLLLLMLIATARFAARPPSPQDRARTAAAVRRPSPGLS